MNKQSAVLPMRPEQRPFRVCIVAGIIEAGDAVSESVRLSISALARLHPRPDVRCEVRGYCLSGTIADSRVHVLGSWTDLLREQFWREADVIIHHFGMFSEIHNAMNFARRDARLVFVFHGITPPQYLPPEAEKLVHKSYTQLGLAVLADHLVTTSSYTLRELWRCGIRGPTTCIPPAIPNAIASEIMKHNQSGEKGKDGPIRLCYCGRFINSKGVIEMLNALHKIGAEEGALEITLAGQTRYSDRGYIEKIREKITTFPPEIKVQLKFDMINPDIATLISGSDLLVLPSRHEGFGVPVAEALRCGTPVLCSDAGALPEVALGLALLVRSGDDSSLEAGLRLALKARRRGRVATSIGEMEFSDWQARARSETDHFDQRSIAISWCRLGNELYLQCKPNHSDWRVASNDAYNALLPLHEDRTFEVVDAQVLGRFVGLKALEAVSTGNDVNDAIAILHVWCFGIRPTAADAMYWRGVLQREGLARLLVTFASSPEARSNLARLNMAPGIVSSLESVEQIFLKSEKLTGEVVAEPEQTFIETPAQKGLDDQTFRPECAVAAARELRYASLNLNIGVPHRKPRKVGLLRWIQPAEPTNKESALHRADLARDRHDWKNAAAIYREVFYCDPERADILVQMGNCLKEAGDYTSSEAAYLRALQLRPNVADTWLQLGHVRKLSDRIGAAWDAYIQALVCDREDSEVQREIKDIK